MRKRYQKTGWGLATAAAVAAAMLLWWGGADQVQATAADVLAQAVEGLSDLRSVHISANMRTLPNDNFEMIGVDYDLVPIEMWKRFDDPPQWRVEKPGRVVVMDGESSLLLIRPNHAAKGGVQTGFVGWLKPLLDVDRVLDNELRRAQKQTSELLLTHEREEDGAAKLVVTIEAPAQGDFTNDWLKNKSISGSAHRRVYRFDAETKLLEDLRVYVRTEDEDVLVFEITEIEYDLAIDPSLFAVALPDDVVWYEEPKPLSDNGAYALLSPEEAARAFFQACADEDWDEALKFYPASAIDQSMRGHLGGLRIISLGEPFQSGRYSGWFIPYQIKLRSGFIKTHNLAVRNDNPGRRYVVDGGI